MCLAVVSILFQSCSTLFNGAVQEIKINSKPENARIYVNGKEVEVH